MMYPAHTGGHSTLHHQCCLQRTSAELKQERNLLSFYMTDETEKAYGGMNTCKMKSIGTG